MRSGGLKEGLLDKNQSFSAVILRSCRTIANKREKAWVLA